MATIEVSQRCIASEGLAIKLASGHCDILVAAASYQPRVHGQTYMKTTEKLTEFIDKTLDGMTRTIPIVCADINDGFGMQRVQGLVIKKETKAIRLAQPVQEEGGNCNQVQADHEETWHAGGQHALAGRADVLWSPEFIED